MLLVYGGQDQSIRPDKNSRAFAAKFKAAKGVIEVREKAEYGHHPHGLEAGDVGAITRFFTK